MSKKFKIKSEKPKEKWRIFNYNDIISESNLLNCPRIDILGNGEITVEGCQGVFEYSDSYIKLKLNKGALIICGSRFNIVTFEGSLINIRGKISSIEFCV